MMQISRKLATAALITTLTTSGFLASVNAVAKPHHHKGVLQMMAKKLELSEQQEDRQALREARKNHKELLDTLVKADTFDETAIRDLIQQNQANVVAAKLQKAKSLHSMWNILDQSQQQKFSPILSKATNKRKHRKIANFKTLRQLDLSDSQKHQIRTLVQAKASMYDPFDDTHSNTRDTVQAMIKAETFDEQSLTQTLTEGYQAKVDSMVENLRLKHQIWNILDQQQQSEYQTLKQQRENNRQHFRQSA